MGATGNGKSFVSRSHNQQNDSGIFSVPLSTVKRGHLIFASEVQWLNLASNLSMPYLYLARFRRYIPHILSQESIITVDYRNNKFPQRPVILRKPLAEISLNGSIPWEIEFRKGITHLDANLAQLQLHSLDVLGSANRIKLVLSSPSGTTFFYFSGGIKQSEIHMPSAAEIKIQISGGSSNLVFEEERFETILNELSLKSLNFDHSKSRYEICIAGGVNDLTINHRG